MMALFMVLWIVGQSDQAKSNIARYFQNPGVFKEGGSSILMGDKKNPVDPLKINIDPIASSAKDKFALMQKQQQEQVLRETGQRLLGRIQAMPKLKDLADQIQVKMTPDGMRVELTDKSNSEFFELGSAKPRQTTTDLLTVISKELGNLNNSLSIEGHTDSRPFVSRDGYGNWELSADRANSARRIMEAHGLQPKQVEAVRGYADRQLFLPDNPMDMRNRRVSILVRYNTPPPEPTKQSPGTPEKPPEKPPEKAPPAQH
jgi:chemotaxis protein MotB